MAADVDGEEGDEPVFQVPRGGVKNVREIQLDRDLEVLCLGPDRAPAPANRLEAKLLRGALDHERAHALEVPGHAVRLPSLHGAAVAEAGIGRRVRVPDAVGGDHARPLP